MKKLIFILTVLLLVVLPLAACGEVANTTDGQSDTTPAATTEGTKDTTNTDTEETTTEEGAAESEGTTEPAATTQVPENTAPITYTSSSWMSVIPDDASLGDLAIPGTHDSGATKDFWSIPGTAKCQSLSIAEQLHAGVRYLDIRIARVNGVLKVYHGIADQELSFDEVIAACYTFLDENPDETLIMCIKEEKDAEGTNDPFDTMVKKYIYENTKKWYTGTNIPTLGRARGKIVLVRRYDVSGTYGFDASQGWRDNTTFSLTYGEWRLSVQDYYDNESPEKKWESIESFFDTMKPADNTLYLNNTSGYKGVGGINTVADYVNPKLIEYLKTSPEIVGIVATDFMTAEIASLIYELNFS